MARIEFLTSFLEYSKRSVNRQLLVLAEICLSLHKAPYYCQGQEVKKFSKAWFPTSGSQSGEIMGHDPPNSIQLQSVSGQKAGDQTILPQFSGISDILSYHQNMATCLSSHPHHRSKFFILENMIPLITQTSIYSIRTHHPQPATLEK